MSLSSRHGRRGSTDIWPGFVDGLATLLVVIIFVLMVFVLIQVMLSHALSGRDEALGRLRNRVSELSDLLALEQQEKSRLQDNVSRLSGDLQATVQERDRLLSQLQAAESTRDQLQIRLTQARESLGTVEEENRGLQETLALAEQALQENESTIESQTAELDKQVAALDRLQAEVSRLEDARDQLRSEVAELAGSLEDREETVSSLREKLAREESVSTAAQAELAVANQQMAALRVQIARLNQALDAAETEIEEQNATIANLGERLNTALASKVQELSRYRSEFFGRLRQVLGDHDSIKVVGDRFVFQSEVLFDTASAQLGPGGRQQVAALADTLKAIDKDIPNDIDWVLRVDGHTDKRPISTARFQSNWELSTARAISVIRELIRNGVPADKLAAAGFGSQQPLDNQETEDAYRRNRRIEIRLDQR